jgi:hypothetical protein
MVPVILMDLMALMTVLGPMGVVGMVMPGPPVPVRCEFVVHGVLPVANARLKRGLVGRPPIRPEIRCSRRWTPRRVLQPQRSGPHRAARIRIRSRVVQPARQAPPPPEPVAP